VRRQEFTCLTENVGGGGGGGLPYVILGMGHTPSENQGTTKT